MKARQPIAKKYRKGKLKSTPIGELKEHEIRLLGMGHPGSSNGVGGVAPCHTALSTTRLRRGNVGEGDLCHASDHGLERAGSLEPRSFAA
jgi:hypothetical protein